VSRVVFCVQNLSVPRDPRVWRQAQTLVTAGYRVAVICPQDPGQLRRERLNGVDILRFPIAGRRGGVAGYIAETLSALAWTSAWALHLQGQQRIDVLHAANPPDTLFLVGLLLRPFGTRFVFDQHDLSPELAASKWRTRPAVQRVLGFLERASFRTADLVIANNDSYLDVALQRGRARPDKVVVIRNGVDSVPTLRHERGCSADPLVVAFGGAMGNQDGIEVLLDAAAMIERDRPGAIRLDMIGSGDHVDRLVAHSRLLGIEPIVTWTGWLCGRQFADRLAAASVGVSPDRGDEFNRTSTMMKVADYIVAGLPCVIADLTENRVTAGEAALYFRPGDAADLARQLLLLIDQPELRARLSRRATERAPALTWQPSAERMIAAYRWLLEGGQPIVPRQSLEGEWQETLVS
jgi:glycosyltransferase involved in cell wall biosynthesis